MDREQTVRSGQLEDVRHRRLHPCEVEAPSGLLRTPVTGHEQTDAGDAVCWLERVCDACGGLDDGPATAVCARCGAPQPAPPGPEVPDRS